MNLQLTPEGFEKLVEGIVKRVVHNLGGPLPEVLECKGTLEGEVVLPFTIRRMRAGDFDEVLSN